MNSFDLNSVDINAGPIGVVSASGTASAVAAASGDQFVHRYALAAGIAFATIVGVAFPTYQQEASATATANVSLVGGNVARRAFGHGFAVATGQAVVESIIDASGNANASATLVGIPTDEIGRGDAFAFAVLNDGAEKVKRDNGAAVCTALAVNSDLDVTRNAFGAIANPETFQIYGGYAYASAEPAFNDVIDASGISASIAQATAEAFVNNVSSGVTQSAATASGFSLRVRKAYGVASGVASMYSVDNNISQSARSSINATAMASGEAIRFVVGSELARANASVFVSAKLHAKGKGKASATGIVQGVGKRFGMLSGSAGAYATGFDAAIKLYDVDGEAYGIATAIGGALTNIYTHAPPERTVIVRTSSVRIVIVQPENREIRIAA